jgi:hypothetical protein
MEEIKDEKKNKKNKVKELNDLSLIKWMNISEVGS